MMQTSRSFSVRSRSLVALATLGLGGCSDPSPVATAAQPVVYGTDDRQDFYAHPDMNLRTLTQQSIVALMRDTAIDVSDPMAVRYTGTSTLRESQNLCAGQRFENDPTHSHCSGTLIDNDIVLTAGHCFTAPGADAEMPTTCANTRFVFKYYHEAAGRLATITAEDVFSCAEIITRVDAMTPDGTRQDYAFVRLNRSAAPRFTPASVTRTNGPTTMGQSVTVIGFGSGIPAKIDSGGTVTNLRAMEGDYFDTNLDTFSGSSGSGVFDTATRNMVGILVRGATDYVPADGGACQVANLCASTPSGATCGGEAVNRLQAPFDDFCRRLPTHRLCGGTPSDAGASDASAATDASDDTGAAADAGPAAQGGGCATSPAPRSGWSMGLALAALALIARRRRAHR